MQFSIVLNYNWSKNICISLNLFTYSNCYTFTTNTNSRFMKIRKSALSFENLMIYSLSASYILTSLDCILKTVLSISHIKYKFNISEVSIHVFDNSLDFHLICETKLNNLVPTFDEAYSAVVNCGFCLSIFVNISFKTLSSKCFSSISETTRKRYGTECTGNDNIPIM